MIPLVLDLDGTIVRSDTLVEAALRVLATRPASLLAALPLAFSDRAAFKQAIARAAPIDANLPYDQDVLALARDARLQGRDVYMATAADRRVADAVAGHLGLFDGVFASDGTMNLKGAHKAAALSARFGEKGFDYAGDSAADMPVWRAARRPILVAPSAWLRRRAERECGIVETVGAEPNRWQLAGLLARALRLHQWTKNLLVFVPLVAAHADGPTAVLRTILAFLAFSLCASSVYVLNDLIDLPHDRAHARKCRRPFASGALALSWAPKMMGLLFGLIGVSCLALPSRFLAVLALYYLCTLSYSFVLKRRMVWDVMMLAGLYTLRIFAGAAASSIPISPWLLTFSLFLFFCLAIVKRLTELTLFTRQGSMQRGEAMSGTTLLAGRGYTPDDADMLRSMASASGTASVVVLALYVNSVEVLALYRHPSMLMGLCAILLFWVSRVLMLANRGQMNDDPVVFALTDRVSLAAAAASLAVILAATL